MKKIIKYLFLLTGGSFILASCNDFLDREPLDSVIWAGMVYPICKFFNRT